MTNKQRGEISIKLAGKEYVMCPTFDAQAAIEEETGKTFMVVAQNIVSRCYSVKEILAVIYCGIAAGDNRETVSRDDVKLAIETGGIAGAEIIKPVADFVGGAILGLQSGGKEAKAEGKASGK